MTRSRFPKSLLPPPAPADIPDDRDHPDGPHPFRYRVNPDAADYGDSLLMH